MFPPFLNLICSMTVCRSQKPDFFCCIRKHMFYFKIQHMFYFCQEEWNIFSIYWDKMPVPALGGLGASS